MSVPSFTIGEQNGRIVRKKSKRATVVKDRRKAIKAITKAIKTNKTPKAVKAANIATTKLAKAEKALNKGGTYSLSQAFGLGQPVTRVKRVGRPKNAPYRKRKPKSRPITEADLAIPEYSAQEDAMRRIRRKRTAKPDISPQSLQKPKKKEDLTPRTRSDLPNLNEMELDRDLRPAMFPPKGEYGKNVKPPLKKPTKTPKFEDLSVENIVEPEKYIEPRSVADIMWQKTHPPPPPDPTLAEVWGPRFSYLKNMTSPRPEWYEEERKRRAKTTPSSTLKDLAYAATYAPGKFMRGAAKGMGETFDYFGSPWNNNNPPFERQYFNSSFPRREL